MKLPRFFGARSPKLSMALDVGSYSVKAVIFQSNIGSYPPGVVKKMTMQLPVLADPLRTARKLHEFLFDAAKELGKVPEKITVGIGPSLAEFSLVTRAVPVAPSRRTISGRELADYFKTMSEQNNDTKQRVIAFPAGVYANGYPISPSVLARSDTSMVKEISFSFLTAALSREVAEAFEHTQKMLGGIQIEFIPIAGAYQEVIRKVLQMKDVFLVDVGEKYTFLMLVKDGIIAALSVFPSGMHQFVSAIAQERGISLEEAERIKRHYTDGLLKSAKSGDARKIFARETVVWKAKFLDALSPFYRAGPITEDVILCGGGAQMPEIRAALLEGDWIKNFSYVDNPRVRVLEARGMFEGDSLGGFLQGPEECGLASLIIYSMHHEPIF